MGKGLSDLLADGLTADLMIHEDCIECWDFMVAHTEKYSKQPTIQTIQENVKFNFELSDEPIDYIRDRFVESVERRMTIEFVREVLGPATNDPAYAGRLSELMLEYGRELKQILPTGEVSRFSDAERRIALFEERAASGDAYIGIKMGIPEIDDATLGIQPHELVAIVGWQGTGKSTLVQWILSNFYLQDKKCLYISLEMTAEALMRKWDQMFQQFASYRHLKMLNLTDEEIKRWRAWAKEAKEAASQREIIVVSDGGSWTSERVHGEILKHRPDVCAIDYLTLMESSNRADEQRWANLTTLTRSLKQIALRTGTPILAISQTNRSSAKEGAQMDNIGGSYSIGADADIVIGLHQEDEDRDQNIMDVKLLKNRDGEILDTEVYWDMKKMRFADNYMMEQIRKTREATKLAEAEAAPDPDNKKAAYKLGTAARGELVQVGDETVDAVTGEIVS